MCGECKFPWRECRHFCHCREVEQGFHFCCFWRGKKSCWCDGRRWRRLLRLLRRLLGSSLLSDDMIMMDVIRGDRAILIAVFCQSLGKDSADALAFGSFDTKSAGRAQSKENGRLDGYGSWASTTTTVPPTPITKSKSPPSKKKQPSKPSSNSSEVGFPLSTDLRDSDPYSITQQS